MAKSTAWGGLRLVPFTARPGEVLIALEFARSPSKSVGQQVG
jgi:hypothetical protein